MSESRIPLLDGLTWDSPLVQHGVKFAIERFVDRALPEPAAPPPDLVALERVGDVIREMRQKGREPSKETDTAATTTASATASSAMNLSNYLQQIGSDGVDTGCLPCARAHFGATEAGLERVVELVQERGIDDPEVRARMATVAEELDALLEYDWTPERIAKSPPEHRAALERYVPEVKDLYGVVAPKGPASQLRAVSRDLKEALRFAREDGVNHEEAQRRMQKAKSQAEAVIDDIERYQLAPERVDEMPADEATWWEDELKPLRRLRQQLHNDADTPQKLHAVAAGFGRMATEAYTPWLRQQTTDKLRSLAEYAADLRQRFKRDTDNL